MLTYVNASSFSYLPPHSGVTIEVNKRQKEVDGMSYATLADRLSVPSRRVTRNNPRDQT